MSPRLLAAAFALGLLLLASPAAAQDALARLQALVAEARGAAQERAWPAALDALEEALALAERSYGARHPVVAFLWDEIARTQIAAVRPRAAIQAGERAVEVLDAAGVRSVDAAIVVGNLGRAYALAGRYDRAVDTYRGGLDRLQATLAADDPRLAVAHRNLAIALQELGEPDAALPHAEAAVAVRAGGSDRAAEARALIDLASVQAERSAFAAAERRLNEAGALLELADDGLDARLEVILGRARLATLRSRLQVADRRLDEAAALLPAAAASPEDHILFARVASARGHLAFLRGHFVDADTFYRAALADYRAAVGVDHPAVARTLHGLGLVQQGLAQPAEAEALLAQAIAIRETLGGASDLGALASRVERVALLVDLGRVDEADTLGRSTLELLDAHHPQRRFERGLARSALGYALLARARFAAAETMLREAVRLIEVGRGTGSSDLPPALRRLALARLERGELAAAERAIRRAVALRERDGAVSAWGLARSLATLGKILAAQGRVDAALDAYARATGAAFDLAVLGDARSRAGTLRERTIFEDYAALLLARLDDRPELADRLVQVVQLPHLTGTAQALREAVASLSSDDPALRDLLADRRGQLERRHELRSVVLDALRRDAAAPERARLEREAAAVDERLAALDARLAGEFPAVADLLRPRPASRSALQAALAPDEVLLLHMSSPEASFYVAVTADGVTARRSAAGRAEVAALVERIRYGVSNERDPHVRFRLFDVEAAHRLYAESVGLVADAIGPADQLFLVADGPLQNLPPHLLLRAPAPLPPERYGSTRDIDFTIYRELPWLARSHAVAVLPSAAALTIGRRFETAARAPEPFFGLGDPSFAGPATPAPTFAADFVTDGRIDYAALRRRLAALPHTRAEVRAVAAALGAGEDALLLGETATEAAVKRRPLERYRVLSFATHALTAGSFEGLGEPALALAPPAVVTAQDDGLLTPGEIVQLKLNADWVLLSACNTAAPAGRPGAEGLSGLAKAFLYAGARSLLASHWAVPSASTAVLMVATISAAQAAPDVSEAAALQRGMMALIDHPEHAVFAHPRFWAPFVVVGGVPRPDAS